MKKIRKLFVLSIVAKFLKRKMKQKSIPIKVDIIQKSKYFKASQVNKEIEELLEIIKELKPLYVCEIGSYRGGTIALFCQVLQPDSKIIAIDIGFTKYQIKVLKQFKKTNQVLWALNSNSKSLKTIEMVKDCLNGNEVDFVFIDGDHSYEGVKKDYELYSPLVSSTGIIAFHDINPDYLTKFNKKTSSYTGGVPKYWREIKQLYGDSIEIIGSNNQDGYGIGVLYNGTKKE